MDARTREPRREVSECAIKLYEVGTEGGGTGWYIGSKVESFFYKARVQLYAKCWKFHCSNVSLLLEGLVPLDLFDLPFP